MAQETEIQKCCCSEEHVHHCGGDVTDAGSHEFILWSWIKKAIDSAKTELIGYFQGLSSQVSGITTAIKGNYGDDRDDRTLGGLRNHMVYETGVIVGDASTNTRNFPTLIGIQKNIDASKGEITSSCAKQGTNTTATLTNTQAYAESILDYVKGLIGTNTNMTLTILKAAIDALPQSTPTDYAKQGDDSSVSLTGVYEAVGGDKWDEGSLSLYELAGDIQSKIENNTYGLAAIKEAIPSASSIKSGLSTSDELENVHTGLADKVNTVIEKVDAVKAVVDAIKAKVDTL